jgi:hypothetical protein
VRRILKIVLQLVWAISLITMGTWIGVAHGWVYHGWLGATVLGVIGFGVGALLAASPQLFLQLLNLGS